MRTFARLAGIVVAGNIVAAVLGLLVRGLHDAVAAGSYIEVLAMVLALATIGGLIGQALSKEQDNEQA